MPSLNVEQATSSLLSWVLTLALIRRGMHRAKTDSWFLVAPSLKSGETYLPIMVSVRYVEATNKTFQIFVRFQNFENQNVFQVLPSDIYFWNSPPPPPPNLVLCKFVLI